MKLAILTAIICALIVNGFVLYEYAYGKGVNSISCPACQECGYRIPGLELIDFVSTKTDKETLKRIAVKETRGRHYVVIEGAAGERGMMQIHPIHGDECYGIGDVSLPENNVRCGDRIFQNCMKKTNGDRKAALCCYNGSKIDKNGSCDYAEKVGER